MKPTAITMLTGAALCSAMAGPASAIPMSNLAASSYLASAESVRYVRNHYRNSSRGYSGYTAGCRYGYGPSSPCYP
jgi:hypothetical protein